MRTRSSILFLSLVLFCIHQPARGQWVSTNGPYGVTAVCFVGSGESVFAGTSSGVYRAVSSDTTWLGAGLTGSFVRALTTDGTNLFAGTPEGVFRSTNNSSSWTSAGLTGSAIFSLLVKGTNLLVGTTSGVFRSTIGDTTWTPIGPPDALVYAFLVDDNRLFTGTSRGVFLSTNDGTTWTSRNSGLTDSIVTALSVSTGGLVAATHFGFVFRSTDQGASWASVGSVGTHITGIVATGSSIIVGAQWGGVYLSSNSGITWSTVGNGLPTIDVRALALIGPNLFAGTFAIGIWKRPLSELVGVELPPVELPNEFVLHQNYPNPFNPNTTIGFGIGKSRHVSLTVHNVLGQIVATLLDEHLKPGIYEAFFDATSLASGVYFYRFQAGSFVQTKRLVLLK